MINVLGINHKTAPLDVRGEFAIIESEVVPLAEKILQETEISELVILSTCNRTEIYYCNQKAYHNKETNQVILGILHHFKKMKARYTEYFYSYHREEAIKHLFRVTSGMDSMVIGEDQIVKQVKDAYLFCTKKSLTDAILMRLFQKSFEVAKKVRSDTDIQQGPTSVSYVAVDLCEKLVDDLSDKNILLIGLGDTGKRVLKNLRRKGAIHVSLCNRTLRTAEKLAAEYGDDVVPFEDFKKHIPKNDIIFTATTAKEYIIKLEDVQISSNGNSSKSKLFIDLSVPRNIDKNIADIQGIQLYGIDDLVSLINDNTQKRHNCLVEAEAIIEEMTKEYIEWLDIRALRPVIQTITKNLKKISSIELKNTIRCYSSEEFKIIEEFSERLTQKYIRSFIKKLKQLSNNGSAVHMLETINELFVFETELKRKLLEVDEVVNK